MGRVRFFRLVLGITVACIAAACAVVLLLNLSLQESGKAQINAILSLFVPSAFLAFLVGLLAFVPKALVGPERAAWWRLWIAHLALSCSACVLIALVTVAMTFLAWQIA